MCRDEEVYKPEQVTTSGGSAVVTIEKKIGTGVTQQPDGSTQKWNRAFVSGFMEGWNKFCYTGGRVGGQVVCGGGWVPRGVVGQAGVGGRWASALKGRRAGRRRRQ